MINQRYEYLDIAKGLGILSVVWAHIMLGGITHEICYAFHMPLFFLISGILFKREKYASFLVFFKHRSKRLFVPYVLYSVITWVIWVIFRMLRGDAVDSYWMPLLQTLIAQGSGAYLVHNSALWFIPCLFAVELMWYFVGKLKDVWAVLISFTLCGVSFLLGNKLGDKWWFLLPWNLDAAFIALPFYCVGNIVAKKWPQNTIVSNVTTHKMGTLILWIALSVLLLLGTMKFDTCSMGSSSYNCDGWAFVLRAFCGCASLLCFSLLLDSIGKSCKFYQKLIDGFKWLGRNSLDVMCTHIPIKGVFILLVGALFHVGTDVISFSLPLCFMVFVATLITEIIVVLFVNRFFRNKSIKCQK